MREMNEQLNKNQNLSPKYKIDHKKGVKTVRCRKKNWTRTMNSFELFSI